jgi:hypothetical protein
MKVQSKVKGLLHHEEMSFQVCPTKKHGWDGRRSTVGMEVEAS